MADFVHLFDPLSTSEIEEFQSDSILDNIHNFNGNLKKIYKKKTIFKKTLNVFL